MRNAKSNIRQIAMGGAILTSLNKHFQQKNAHTHFIKSINYSSNGGSGQCRNKDSRRHGYQRNWVKLRIVINYLKSGWINWDTQNYDWFVRFYFQRNWI